jgi:ankyrin repeat protein
MELLLFIAAAKGSLEEVKDLIKRGAVTTKTGVDGVSLCHVAAASGSIRVLQYLIEEDSFYLFSKDHNDRTMLHVAAHAGEPETSKYLLQKGIRVDTRDANGYTPLHDASQRGRLVVMKLLIEAGADVNCQSRYNGYTPLRFAKESGKKEAVDLLISRGADS